MREVSREEFYRVTNPLSLTPRDVNRNWPFITDFHLASNPGGPAIGRTVSRNDKANGGWHYYLAGGADRA